VGGGIILLSCVVSVVGAWVFLVPGLAFGGVLWPSFDFAGGWLKTAKTSWMTGWR
jgi:hypothetical protein